MEHVSLVERIIIQEILGATDARFWSVSVFDGERVRLKKSRDFQTIKGVIGATDETTLRFCDSEGVGVGSVLLVHGNEADVIGEFTDSPAMAALMAGANAIADQFGVRHV